MFVVSATLTTGLGPKSHLCEDLGREHVRESSHISVYTQGWHQNSIV